MCLAEYIVFDVLKTLGFDSPKEHPDWKIIVDRVQVKINVSMDVMKRVVKHDIDIENRQFQRKSKLGKIIECLKS